MELGTEDSHEFLQNLESPININDFEKFMNHNIHVFNDLGEFMDEYHYKPYLHDDFGLISDINECIWFDIDLKQLPNNIEDFKYDDYNYESNLLNYIRNKELHDLCVENGNENENKLKNIYNMIIKLRK